MHYELNKHDRASYYEKKFNSKGDSSECFMAGIASFRKRNLLAVCDASHVRSSSLCNC